MLTTDPSDLPPPSDGGTDYGTYHYYVDSDFTFKTMATGATSQAYGGMVEAINAAQGVAKAGEFIKVAPGRYKMNSDLRIYQNVVGSVDANMNPTTCLYAKGDMGETMISMKTGSPSPSNLLENVTFANFEVDGLGGTYTSARHGGVQADWIYNCKLDNLYVHNCPARHGIQLQAGHYSTISNCVIDYIGSAALGQYGNGICSGERYQKTYPTKSGGYGSRGLNFSASHNYLFNNTVSNCYMVGINWEPGEYNTMEECVVYGTPTYFTDTNSAKVVTKAADIAPTPDMVPISSHNRYINCDFSQTGGVIMNRAAYSSFEGCTFTQTGTHPSGMQGSGDIGGIVCSTTGKNLTVKDCTFSGNHGYAIATAGKSGTLVQSGNIFTNWNGKGTIG